MTSKEITDFIRQKEIEFMRQPQRQDIEDCSLCCHYTLGVDDFAHHLIEKIEEL